MTQSGAAKNTFFLVTPYNFQKRGKAKALAAPSTPQSLRHDHFWFPFSDFLFCLLIRLSVWNSQMLAKHLNAIMDIGSRSST